MLGEGRGTYTAHHVAWEGVDGARGYGLVVVPVVEKHGPEVADYTRQSLPSQTSKTQPTNVDNKELDPPVRPHRKITPPLVPPDRMPRTRLHQQVVHPPGAPHDVGRGVRREGEEQNDGEHHDGVEIVGQQGGLEAADEGVERYAEGEEEDGGDGVDPRQGVDRRAAACEEHEGHQDV